MEVRHPIYNPATRAGTPSIESPTAFQATATSTSAPISPSTASSPSSTSSEAAGANFLQAQSLATSGGLSFKIKRGISTTNSLVVVILVIGLVVLLRACRRRRRRQQIAEEGLREGAEGKAELEVGDTGIYHRIEPQTIDHQRSI